MVSDELTNKSYMVTQEMDDFLQKRAGTFETKTSNKSVELRKILNKEMEEEKCTT